MADSDKAKAEKLAAAKKRVEQLKKQKAKQSKDKKEKAGSAAAAATTTATAENDDTGDKKPEEVEDESTKKSEPAEDTVAKEGDEHENENDDDDDDDDDVAVMSPSPLTPATAMAEQSRLRSTSFRRGSSGALSPKPEGENTAVDIYRKQAARIEELERQNKRLGKDASDAEKRWKKSEEELADLRDGTSSGDAGEMAKLKSEIATLQRQNSQLQARSTPRHGPSPSISGGALPASELEAQLRSKSTTIENMELEVSRLHAQIERLTMGGVEAGEEGQDLQGRQSQVAALEEKLARAEKAAGSAQRELTELKRNLERTSEKAVREGSARTSAETQLRTLEKEVAERTAERDELARKAEALEKKVTTLTTLHKEHDTRTQALRRDKERVDHELTEMRARLDRAEADNLAMRKREAQDAGGTDTEHLDELEDEERQRFERLERRVRTLEAENADLRHGIWQDRRRELQPGPDEAGDGSRPPHRFSDVDLGGGASGHKKGGASVGGFFTALTGGHDHAAAAGGHPHHRQPSGLDDDGFLDDDDMDFDEEAFRKAQEEEAKARLERVREAKRALKNWEGWRLDLVESRQGGIEGIGPVFEI